MIYIKMLLDCDWLISVQLIQNRSAKCVITMQFFVITVQKSVIAMNQSKSFKNILMYIINNYYMASITSGVMADYGWLRSTFSGPLFPRNGSALHYVKTNACILKQTSKTNRKLLFSLEGIHCYFLFSSVKCLPR
jgi:hypothetical protein